MQSVFLHNGYSLQHMFFFLLQTEQGDIFKVTLETEDDVVSPVEFAQFFAAH